MESGSLELIPSPGIPPLVLKIENGEASTNVRDLAGAALRMASADRSPQPGIVEFLKEWTQMEDTKEFEAKKKLEDAKASSLPANQKTHEHSAHK